MTDENLRTLPDSVPDLVGDLFALANQMREAGCWDFGIEVHAIAVSLSEGLGLV